MSTPVKFEVDMGVWTQKITIEAFGEKVVIARFDSGKIEIGVSKGVNVVRI